MSVHVAALFIRECDFTTLHSPTRLLLYHGPPERPLTAGRDRRQAIAKQRGTRQLRDKPRSVDDMSRNNKKAMNSMRDRATVKRLLMYREKAPEKRIRPESTMRQAKVAPNRKWFGNTRVIGQKELSQFRDEIENKVNDPYTVILKGKKLPMSLLTDAAKSKPVKILDVETFEETFSKDRRRKRPRLSGGDLDDLLLQASQAQDGYSADKDSNLAGVHEYAVRPRPSAPPPCGPATTRPAATWECPRTDRAAGGAGRGPREHLFQGAVQAHLGRCCPRPPHTNATAAAPTAHAPASPGAETCCSLCAELHKVVDSSDVVVQATFRPARLLFPPRRPDRALLGPRPPGTECRVQASRRRGSPRVSKWRVALHAPPSSQRSGVST